MSVEDASTRSAPQHPLSYPPPTPSYHPGLGPDVPSSESPSLNCCPFYFSSSIYCELGWLFMAFHAGWFFICYAVAYKLHEGRLCHSPATYPQGPEQCLAQCGPSMNRGSGNE